MVVPQTSSSAVLSRCHIYSRICDNSIERKVLDLLSIQSPEFDGQFSDMMFKPLVKMAMDLLVCYSMSLHLLSNYKDSMSCTTDLDSQFQFLFGMRASERVRFLVNDLISKLGLCSDDPYFIPSVLEKVW